MEEVDIEAVDMEGLEALLPGARSHVDRIAAPHIGISATDLRARVAAGKGQQLIPVTRPIPLTIAAAVYVDKYGSVDDFDYTRHIPAVPVPLLVTIGAREGVDPTAAPIIPFAGTTEYLPALGKQNPHMSHLFIPGGDHWYAGCEVPLRDAVIDFLDRVPNR